MANKATTVIARFMLVLLAIFMLLQVVLFGAFWWLHSTPGQRFLQAQIATAMEGSGYSLQLGGIGYRPFNAVAVKDIVLTDDAGGRIAIDSATLRVGLAPMLRQTLLFTLNIGAVSFVPSTQETPPVQDKPSDTMAAFSVPDIYFKSIVLRSFKIGKIVSGSDVVAEDVSAAGRIDLSDKISARLAVTMADSAHASISTEFDPRALHVNVNDILADVYGIKISGKGQADLGDGGKADIALTAQADDLSKLADGVTGQAQASLNVTGNTFSPDIVANGLVTLTGENGRDLTPINLNLSAKNIAKNLKADLSATTSYQRHAIKASVQAEQSGEWLSLQKIIVSLPGISINGGLKIQTATQNMNGQIKLGLNNLSLLMPDVSPEYMPNGRIDISFKDNDIITKGNLKLAGRNIAVNGNTVLSLPDSLVTIRSLRMTDGERGSLQLNGTYGFADPVKADIKAALRSFQLPLEGPLQGAVSGDLTLAQNADAYKLSGVLKPDRLDITIPEKFGSNIPTLNVIRPGQKRIAAPDFLELVETEISIVAPKRIFVRGWGLDAEFGGTISVNGHLNDPQVNGTFSSIRGRFEEFGKRFTIDHADLRFQGSVPPSPYLDIKAVINADGTEAAVLLTGSAAKPEIGFSSVPSLPKDEVLSRILFGRDMRKLSPFEAIQLADTLRRFSGEGGSSGFNPLSAFRNAIGLDDFRVDQDDSGQTTVGAGKYISDKVYVELKKGSGDDTGAASVNIDVTRNIKLQSEIGQSRGAGGGVSWQWDY